MSSLGAVLDHPTRSAVDSKTTHAMCKCIKICERICDCVKSFVKEWLNKVLDHSNFHLKSLKGFTKFSWKFSLPITGRLQKVLFHGSFLHQSLKGFTQYYITEVFHHQSLKGVTKIHITEFSPPITESTVLFHGSFFRQSGRIYNALYHGSST